MEDLAFHMVVFSFFFWPSAPVHREDTRKIRGGGDSAITWTISAPPARHLSSTWTLAAGKTRTALFIFFPTTWKFHVLSSFFSLFFLPSPGAVSFLSGAAGAAGSGAAGAAACHLTYDLERGLPSAEDVHLPVVSSPLLVLFFLSFSSFSFLLLVLENLSRCVALRLLSLSLHLSPYFFSQIPGSLFSNVSPAFPFVFSRGSGGSKW